MVLAQGGQVVVELLGQLGGARRASSVLEVACSDQYARLSAFVSVDSTSRRYTPIAPAGSLGSRASASRAQRCSPGPSLATPGCPRRAKRSSVGWNETKGAGARRAWKAELMAAPGELDIEYIDARRVLLDALEAVGSQIGAVTLIGAQAVYLRIADWLTDYQPYTTDADLVLDPDQLTDLPALGDAMRNAGFALTDEPGIWEARFDRKGADEKVAVPVDLIVPESIAPTAGRRSARRPRQEHRTQEPQRRGRSRRSQPDRDFSARSDRHPKCSRRCGRRGGSAGRR